MDVTDVVEKQQKPKTSAEQKRLARDRQRNHRSRVAQEEIQSERDQRNEENWNQRRHALQVVSLFESAPGVLCADISEQLLACRLMARRCIVRPVLRDGDTYRSYFQRVLENWLSPRWRAAGRSITRDEIVYSVRFNYRAENIPDLCAEMCTGVDPDQLIDVAELAPLPWRRVPAKPAEPVDEKVQIAHAEHDRQVRDERAVREGKFSVTDAGVNFLLQPDGGEAYTFPRSFPTDLLWPRWSLLAIANRYLDTHPDDERFCPDVRARIARVYTFRSQSIKTNFNRGMED